MDLQQEQLCLICELPLTSLQDVHSAQTLAGIFNQDLRPRQVQVVRTHAPGVGTARWPGGSEFDTNQLHQGVGTTLLSPVYHLMSLLD